MGDKDIDKGKVYAGRARDNIEFEVYIRLIWVVECMDVLQVL